MNVRFYISVQSSLDRLQLTKTYQTFGVYLSFINSTLSVPLNYIKFSIENVWDYFFFFYLTLNT